MRENLYRGKRKDNQEWVKGGILHQTDYYGAEVDKWFIFDGTYTYDYNIGEWFEVAPETIGQYTSLPDRNRKKIFEGDIVKAKYDNTVGIVCFGRYGGGNLGFYIKWVGTHNYLRKDIAFWIDEREEIEVIGNIYDDNHLLKEND